MNKIYDLGYITIYDQINILEEIFSSKIKTKEAIISKEQSDYLESILNHIRENNFNKSNNNIFRTFVFKWNNYYWRKLNEEEIEKNILYNTENDNLEKKLKKKFNLLKEPSYKLFLLENEKNTFKIIFKFNSIINEKYANLLNDFIKKNIIKENKEYKKNKFIKIIFDFISYPIDLIFEILVILFLNNI